MVPRKIIFGLLLFASSSLSVHVFGFTLFLPLSLLDALTLIGNVERHATFLEATVVHLRQRLGDGDPSEVLRHNTRDVSLATLETSLRRTELAASRLVSSLTSLDCQVKEVS